MNPMLDILFSEIEINETIEERNCKKCGDEFLVDEGSKRTVCNKCLTENKEKQNQKWARIRSNNPDYVPLNTVNRVIDSTPSILAARKIMDSSRTS